MVLCSIYTYDNAGGYFLPKQMAFAIKACEGAVVMFSHQFHKYAGKAVISLSFPHNLPSDSLRLNSFIIMSVSFSTIHVVTAEVGVSLCEPVCVRVCVWA